MVSVPAPGLTRAEMIRILHIDDNPDDLELSKLLLEHMSADVSVSSAATASEAVASIAQQEYDCIICDYNLPDVDGLSLLQNLRQNGDSTPFIILTGEGNEEVAATALRSGADDYYVKKTGTAHYRDMLGRIRRLNEEKRKAHEALITKAAARTAAAAESPLAAAIDSLRDAFFVLDSGEYRIRFCNRAAERLFGFSREEMIGSGMEKLVLSKFVFQDLLGNLAERNNGIHENIQLSMRTRANDIIIADVTLTSFAGQNGNGQDLVLIARDDSRNRIREIALREECNLLEQRVEDLAGVRNDYESFVSTVSHDLRSHVNNIVEFSQIVEADFERLQPEESRRYLSIIRATGLKLRSVLDGLLNLSRANSAKLEMREVNLSAIAESILHEFAANQPERTVTYHVERGMTALGDETLLQSALYNLLHNAWKYSSGREAGEITFSCMHEGGKRVYFVEDNGIGFDTAQKDKLFKPFQRLHNGDEFPGTGLGLSIVQRIINRHGGSIWAESEEDQGTSFYFTLN